MTSTIYLDEKYSTTRLLTQDKPEIINNSEDKFESVLFLPMGENRKGEGGLRTKGYFKKSYEDKPLISIITVVFNGEQYLEETIQSVINQTYDNVEYIIIDGGSTDGTLEIIKKYEDKIDYWVSERDSGISDAFNKGIRTANGKLVGLINADDWYEKSTVELVVINYLKNYEGVYCGELKYWKGHQPIYVVKSNPERIYQEMTINHPTVFMSKSIYKSIGLFSLSCKYAMDYDLLLKVFVMDYKFYNVKALLANMSFDGVSDINWEKALIEVRDSKIANGISKINAYQYYYFQLIRRRTRDVLIYLKLDSLVKFYRKKFSINQKL